MALAAEPYHIIMDEIVTLTVLNPTHDLTRIIFVKDPCCWTARRASPALETLNNFILIVQKIKIISIMRYIGFFGQRFSFFHTQNIIFVNCRIYNYLIKEIINLFVIFIYYNYTFVKEGDDYK